MITRILVHRDYIEQGTIKNQITERMMNNISPNYLEIQITSVETYKLT